MNRAAGIDEVEVERAAVREMQHPLEPEAVQRPDVEAIESREMSFDLDVRWNRTFSVVSEVLIDSEVIVDAPHGRARCEQTAVG